MLIHCITLGLNPKFGKLSRDEFFQRAWEMGLREHPNFFFPFVYGFDFANSEKMTRKDFVEIAKEFAEHYTKEEIDERFTLVSKNVDRLNRPYQFDTTKGRYTSSYSNEKLDLLTILYHAQNIVHKCKVA